jgi:hypothetical protein
MNNLLKNYFEHNFKNFCLICDKNSNNITCNECKLLVSNLSINNLNKLYFLKNLKYWMHGENKYGEKIKSYFLYCIQSLIPLKTDDIIKHIKEINLILETVSDYKIEIKTINEKNLILSIPKVKNDFENFISYQNLILYPELENNIVNLISN